MSITPLDASTDTFRTWVNTTNTIIDTLNANTLVAGVEATGTFKIGSGTDLESSLSIGGGKLTANGQNVVVNVATTLNSNVSIGTSASSCSVSPTGNVILTPTSTTIISSPNLSVRAIAEFNAATTFANTVQMTGSLVTITTATLNTATVNVATLNTATITSLTVQNALTYSNTFIVQGNTTISNTLSVSGNTTFTGANVTIIGKLSGSNTLSIIGATTLSNTLNVTGATLLSNTLIVTGNTTLSKVSISNVTNEVYFDSSARVAGAVNALSTVMVTGAVNALSTLGVTGATILSNTLSVTGATTLGSTLAVTGTTTIFAGLTATSLTTSGTLAVANTVVLGNQLSSGSTGTLRVAWGGGGETYIQSGLSVSQSPPSSADLVFSNIGGSTEWMRIQSSAQTLKVNGAIQYTRSQVMRWNNPSTDARVANTTYRAETDGFVLATIDGTVYPGGIGEVEILTDNNSSPSTRGGITGTVNGRTTLTVPIKKDDYYTAVVTGSGTLSATVRWVALGTGTT